MLADQEVVQAPVDTQPEQRIIGRRVFVQPPDLPGGYLLLAIALFNVDVNHFVLELGDII